MFAKITGMYPDNEELTIFGEKVQWPGVGASGKFTNGSFTDPLERPSFIPAGTINLILDNLSTLITKLGGAPNNTAIDQLAGCFTNAPTANTSIMRDAQGRAQVAAPQAANDIARKAEVDVAISIASGLGVCKTESSITGKTVTIEGVELVAGRRICVKFTDGNTASEPTLNVNSLGAKPITMDGLPVYTGCFDAGGVYEFVYDSTNWECLSGMVRTQAHGKNSGYIKYRNGLLVQTGFLSRSRLSDVSVLFPLVFSENCLSIAVTPDEDAAVGTGAFVSVKTRTLSQTGFVVRGIWNSGYMNAGVYYIAVGF